jgi:hypothetical protein
MFGIQFKNKFLDLYPKTALSFDLRNPAYFGEDVEVIQESFMFTTSVPMTALNRRLLVNPNRLDNASFLLTNEECSVYCEGIETFRGLLTVRSSTSVSAEVFVKVNTISVLKELLLSELDHDTINLDKMNIPLSYLTNSCFRPELYDFICFPVWNQNFYDEPDTNIFDASSYQNRWTSQGPGGSIIVRNLAIGEKSPITPFLKVSYLLKKMAQTTGFILSNNWQVNRELKNLCAYNNRSIVRYHQDGTFDAFDNLLEFKNHVSKVKSSDYLKNLARLFNLGIYVNFFDKSMDVVPNETLLAQAPRHDWTRRVLSDHTKTEAFNFPSRFGYSTTPSVLPDVTKLTRFPTAAQYSTSPEGLYLNDVNSRYYHAPDDVQGPLIAVELNNFVKISDNDKNVFNSPLQTLPNSRIFMGDMGVCTAPGIKQKGTYKIKDAEESEAGFEDKLLFYRGFADFRDYQGRRLSPNDGSFFPLASSESETITGYRIKTGWDSSVVVNTHTHPQYAPELADYTLSWNGRKGLYARWWAAWHTMLQQKRDVKLTVGLSTKEVRNFNFQHKVRIKNREYLVKRLRVTLTESGVSPSEVELVMV